MREHGMVCCGGIVGMGESLEQRAELAAQLRALGPDKVPLNFLQPRPGTPFAELPMMGAREALRTIAAFRLALPRTTLRFGGAWSPAQRPPVRVVDAITSGRRGRRRRAIEEGGV